jgi:serine/threonine protein kinase
MFSLVYDCHECGASCGRGGLICDCGALLVNGLSPGAVICGRYRYLATIGSGGMGLIVKAYDASEDCEVALKMLLRNNHAGEVTRFMQECRATANLSHRSIVKTKEYGVTDDGYPFMVMEYLSGEDLGTRLSRQGALDLADTLDLFYQLCDTMSYAHAQGVVHRDLKPSNIMLLQQPGSKQKIKIVDFGIAKVVYSDENSTQSDLTRTGQIIGSPPYMSPEQALGKKIDFRTDIYSAGCVIYHALTGAPPIHGDSAIETLFKHVNEVPPSMSEASLGRTFSPALEEVVATALKKDPAQRFQTFEEFKQALISVQKGTSTASAQNLPATAASKPSRRSLPTTLAIACIILSVGALSVLVSRSLNRKAAAQSPASFDQAASPQSQAPDLDDSNSAMTIAADQAFTRGMKSMIDYDVDSLNSKVDLSEHGVTDEEVGYFLRRLKTGHAHVTSLTLSKSEITDESMKLLADSHLPLKILCVGKTKITGEGLKSIAQIGTLEVLAINDDVKIDPRSLHYIGNLKRLEHLDMNGLIRKPTEDQNFAFLSKLMLLRSLSLNVCPGLPVHALKYAERLPQFTKLTFCSSGLTDASLEDIGHIDSLEELILNENKITTKGINSLTALTGLTTLECKGNSKIDSEVIPAFAKMRNLTKLTLGKRLREDPEVESQLPPQCELLD